MKKLVNGLAFVLIIAAGVWMLKPNSSNLYASHLGKAREALVKLDKISRGQTVVESSQVASIFIATAYAEEETSIDDQVEALVEIVVEETQQAIESAEELGNTEELQSALQEIDELQDETVEVLAEVVEVVEEEGTFETIAQALEETETTNIEVETAAEVVEEAIETGGQLVVVDIVTTIDEEDAEEEEQAGELVSGSGSVIGKFVNAKDLYEEVKEKLDANEDLIDSSIQKKLERIEVALANCEESEDAPDCKVGRIKGLSTALKAKIRNQERKLEKKQNKNQKKKKEEVNEEENESENEEAESIPAENAEISDSTEAQEEATEKKGNSQKDKNKSQGKGKGKGNKSSYKNEETESIPAGNTDTSDLEAVQESDEAVIETKGNSQKDKNKSQGKGNGKGNKSSDKNEETESVPEEIPDTSDLTTDPLVDDEAIETKGNSQKDKAKSNGQGKGNGNNAGKGKGKK